MTHSVVELIEIESAIIQVKMQDRTHKNAFSQELTDGLIQAFEYIRQNPKLQSGHFDRI
ncbi:enoyl-CoA hydratase/carnithine racemase [Bacillus subtilis]